MGQVRHVDAYRRALDEDDGAATTPDELGYVTLTVDTFFFPLGGSDSPTISVEAQTDGTIAATLVCVECTNAPKEGPGAVTDWDDSATSPWVRDDSAVNSFLSSNGTGWTATVLSMAKTAGVGNAIWNLHGRGAKRYRLRMDVGTGGKVRVSDHSKTGG
jgi:hypothetical protein